MDETENNCPICYEPITHQVKLACNHIFCLTCIVKTNNAVNDIVKNTFKCAYCRQDLNHLNKLKKLKRIKIDLGLHVSDLQKETVVFHELIVKEYPEQSWNYFYFKQKKSVICFVALKHLSINRNLLKDLCYSQDITKSEIYKIRKSNSSLLGYYDLLIFEIFN